MLTQLSFLKEHTWYMIRHVPCVGREYSSPNDPAKCTRLDPRRWLYIQSHRKHKLNPVDAIRGDIMVEHMLAHVGKTHVVESRPNVRGLRQWML